MKKLHFLLCILISVSACTDDNFDQDYGCVNILDIRQEEQGINSGEVSIAHDLLQANAIRFDNLRFNLFINDEAHHAIHISAEQYTNGLPVFFSALLFNFSSGVAYPMDGQRRYPADAPRLPRYPTLNGAVVRGLYFQELKNHGTIIENIDVSCINIRFGYVNINPYSASAGVSDLRRAWLVRPSTNDVPVAVFFDVNGETQYFFDGRVSGG